MRAEDVPEAIEALRPFFTQVVEGQLKDYGESANAGCWVSFRLPTPEDLECYRGQDRSGRNARTGKRYTLMVIELSDAEVPVRNQETQKGYKLSQIAGLKGHDQKFWAFVQAVYGNPVDSVESCAGFVRGVCGVESRAELDTSMESAKIFRGLLQEFDDWQKR